MKATYINPHITDSDENKERCVKEKNFNLMLKRIIEDSITAAIPLFQTHINKMAGPFTESEALEFAKLMEDAYYGKLEPVPLNPYMEEEKKKEKVGPNSKFTVDNIFPITPAKVKEYVSSSTDPSKQAQGKSILVAPKSLVVSIIDEKTSVNFQRIYDKRTKEMNPRSSGSSSRAVSSGSTNAAVSRSFSARSGVASSLVIQELIQLVRSVIDDNESLVKTK